MNNNFLINSWGLGIGDWGLGVVGLGAIPKTPKHKPQNQTPHFL